MTPNEHHPPAWTDSAAAADTGSRRNPALFVVGCPRSGTTLLQRMLDHHPGLAVANDSHFIPRALEEVDPRAFAGAANGRNPPLSEGLVDWVRRYHRFPRLGLADSAVAAAAARGTYRDFVSTLYDAYARRHGKTLAGEKTPDYARHLPLLHGLFPWVRSIHLIRDGRDVALSLLDWAREGQGPRRFALWKTAPVAVCALWWKAQVSAARTQGGVLGSSRYHEVFYEPLVDQPEPVLRNVANFLGLPFAKEMLAYWEGNSHLRDPSAGHPWMPPTHGLRDWRAQMRPEEVELFEALAGDLLTELGYQRHCEVIRPQAAELAARCLSWWESEMRRRQEKLLRRIGRTPPAAGGAQ